MKVIMGIDQSITNTGVTVCVGKKYSYYLLKTKREKGTKCPTIDNTRRIVTLKLQIKDLIEKYNVQLIAIEGMAFGGTGRSIFDIGGLSHVFRELFLELDKKFIVVPPTVLKKWWFGKGNASKIQMISEAENRGFDIPFLKTYEGKKRFNDNVVDSLALCEFLNDYNAYLDKIEISW